MDTDFGAAVRAAAGEEVGVVGIARDPKRVQRRDAAVDERDLSFRQRVRSRHEVDVAHRALPPDREIKDSRAYSPSQQTSFERTTTRVRNVEDRLVERCLRRQSGRGE